MASVQWCAWLHPMTWLVPLTACQRMLPARRHGRQCTAFLPPKRFVAIPRVSCLIQSLCTSWTEYVAWRLSLFLDKISPRWVLIYLSLFHHNNVMLPRWNTNTMSATRPIPWYRIPSVNTLDNEMRQDRSTLMRWYMRSWVHCILAHINAWALWPPHSIPEIHGLFCKIPGMRQGCVWWHTERFLSAFHMHSDKVCDAGGHQKFKVSCAGHTAASGLRGGAYGMKQFEPYFDSSLPTATPTSRVIMHNSSISKNEPDTFFRA